MSNYRYRDDNYNRYHYVNDRNQNGPRFSSWNDNRGYGQGDRYSGVPQNHNRYVVPDHRYSSPPPPQRNFGGNPNYRPNFQGGGGSDRKVITVPTSDVGKVIGRGGSTIKSIQSRTGARVRVNNDNSGHETSVDIFGDPEQIRMVERLIDEIVGRDSSSKPFSFNQKMREISQAPTTQPGFSFNRTFQQIQQHQVQPSSFINTSRSFFPQVNPMMQSMGQSMEVSYVPQSSMGFRTVPVQAMAMPSIFPQSNIVHLPPSFPQIDLSVYSDLNTLSAVEIEQFSNDNFDFKYIPTNAPARELCF
ncbi:uncharacterized protein LOC141852405 [Brevipalpus obovatus]|uniref:uncharacterized protein LOC141852405 n=1 Tax=Brevipalpus obovatus TaxID=246614 RepID=UPI003D9E9C5E